MTAYDVLEEIEKISSTTNNLNRILNSFGWEVEYDEDVNDIPCPDCEALNHTWQDKVIKNAKDLLIKYEVTLSNLLKITDIEALTYDKDKKK